MIINLILTIVLLASMWKLFQKMGYQGWQGIVPGYNLYILFDELYGNGWQVFMLFIPFFNIYLIIKLYIDWAVRFGKKPGYGVGMFFLGFVFNTILAFGPSKYMDGSKAKESNDVVTNVIDNVASGIASLGKKQEKEEKKPEETKSDGV